MGLAANNPKIIWVELTSKCPFDCIFCTRKLDRGFGQHMSFELYGSLISQLVQPEIIRLNYSGESIHYPHLGEAIRLARGTGATTELVSAFSSASSETVRCLVDSGLHRLSISFHTTDSQRYQEIYRFGSVETLFQRIVELREYQRKRVKKYPEIDFAFVAMKQNLPELREVVRRAAELGVSQVSVHPVIRRRPTFRRFPDELDANGDLLPEFESVLMSNVHAIAQEIPQVAVTVARPTSPVALREPGIPICEQNPWETVHILADGSVVVCEVQDRIKIGSLTQQSLSEIWQGQAYREFREQYAGGRNEVCRRCAWRQSAPAIGEGVFLFRGWHPSLSDPVKWSQKESCLLLEHTQSRHRLRISGILPPSLQEGSNELTVESGHARTARVENRTSKNLQFDLEVPLPAQASRWEVVTIRTKNAYCPALEGTGPDLRRLGFGLLGVGFNAGSREGVMRRLFGTLRRIDRLSHTPIRKWWRPTGREKTRASGLSILIPERDSPRLLRRCLEAVEQARLHVTEPLQVVVVVSGTASEKYEPLRRAFNAAEWIFRTEVLPFRAAVARGLAAVRHPWVYLLNNDMVLDERALTEVLPFRGPETFAVGSRIEMEDGSDTESNWTDARYPEGDAAELLELDPTAAVGPRGCLYAGGGSALFRTNLLRRMVMRTRAYDPFYWEDAEWGATAWRYGYRSVYCPSSRVKHGGRRTVGRFYSANEIERVFQRNRLLFHLRNVADVGRIRARLMSVDQATWNEIFSCGTLLEMLRARLSRALAPFGDEALNDRWRLEF